MLFLCTSMCFKIKLLTILFLYFQNFSLRRCAELFFFTLIFRLYLNRLCLTGQIAFTFCILVATGSFFLNTTQYLWDWQWVMCLEQIKILWLSSSVMHATNILCKVTSILDNIFRKGHDWNCNLPWASRGSSQHSKLKANVPTSIIQYADVMELMHCGTIKYVFNWMNSFAQFFRGQQSFLFELMNQKYPTKDGNNKINCSIGLGICIQNPVVSSIHSVHSPKM